MPWCGPVNPFQASAHENQSAEELSNAGSFLKILFSQADKNGDLCEWWWGLVGVTLPCSCLGTLAEGLAR